MTVSTPSPKELDALIAELGVRTEEATDLYIPNPPMIPFHQDVAKYHERWIIAGNRAGKTRAGAQEAIWWATGRHPYFDAPLPNYGWVVSLDFNESRTITEAYIKDLLPERMIERVVRQNNSIIQLVLKNGSKIEFKACEQGWQKFQGGGVDWVWIDEEPQDERVYNEIKMRVKAGRRLHIWGTMTPLNGFTWSYKRIYTKQGEDIKVYAASMMDNPHLPKEEVARMKDQILPREFESRVFGKYAVFSGLPFFSPDKVAEIEKDCFDGEKGEILGDLKPKFVASRTGRFELWEPPSREGVYIIGADIASEQGPNKSVASVFNRETWEKVGMWWGNTHPKDFAKVLQKIGLFYNSALIVPERNNQGMTTVTELRDMNYPRIFRMHSYGKEEETESQNLGFDTNPRTRPVMLDFLAHAVQNRTVKIYSAATLDQYRSFVLDSDGRPEAQRGCDDDIVMADAIALQGCAAVAAPSVLAKERALRKRRIYDPRTGAMIGARSDY